MTDNQRFLKSKGAKAGPISRWGHQRTRFNRVYSDEVYTSNRISVSYDKRGLFSSFDQEFSWRGLLTLNGYCSIELDDGIADVVSGCYAPNSAD